MVTTYRQPVYAPSNWHKDFELMGIRAEDFSTAAWKREQTYWRVSGSLLMDYSRNERRNWLRCSRSGKCSDGFCACEIRVCVACWVKGHRAIRYHTYVTAKKIDLKEAVAFGHATSNGRMESITIVRAQWW